jgi:hypothetical protein
MRYFDYETVAREAGIASDKLDQLVNLFTLEEPNDSMLAELHILRACMAIRAGRLTLEEALRDARKLAA